MNTLSGSGFVSSTYMCPSTVNEPIALCGDITADTTWSYGYLYVLSCQIHVKNGATLSIQPGTTIYAAPVDGAGVVRPARLRACPHAGHCSHGNSLECLTHGPAIPFAACAMPSLVAPSVQRVFPLS